MKLVLVQNETIPDQALGPDHLGSAFIKGCMLSWINEGKSDNLQKNPVKLSFNFWIA